MSNGPIKPPSFVFDPERMKAIQDSVVPSSELKEIVNSAANRAIAELQRTIRSIPLPKIDFSPFLPPNLASVLQEASGLGRLFGKLDEMARRDGLAHERLWTLGWTVSMDMPLVWVRESVDLIDARPARAHVYLAAWYTHHLDEIEAALTRLHPTRAAILVAAFAAHRRKDYALSVPALLAQCDGLAHDVLQVGLYTARGREVANAILSSPLGTYMKNIGAILGKDGPIHAPSSELDPSSDPLNRHEVLHGRVTNYATRRKSLQAVALASFIGVDLAEAIWEAEAKLAEWRTSSEGLRLASHRFEGGNPTVRPIAGTVANDSERTYTRVEVRIELLGKDGTVIGRASVKAPGIEAGGSCSFRATFDASGARQCRVAALVGL